MVLGPWLLFSCGPLGPGGDTAEETGWNATADSATTRPQSWVGTVPEGGLGASLAVSEHGVWSGAPWGTWGTVWLLDAPAVSVFPDVEQVSLGWELAADPSGILAVGAPLANEGEGLVLRTDGVDESEAPGNTRGGRLLWSGEDLWSGGGDRVLQGHAPLVLPDRLGDLEEVAGQVVVGLPRGPLALWTEDVSWERSSARDEAGYSLCRADLDGDGSPDLAVGAPGSDQVLLLLGDPETWVLTEHVLQGPPGRFGHALACRQGALAVGAPLAEEGAGAVWLFEGQMADWAAASPWAVGQALGDHFGAALALNEKNLWVGSPRAEAHDGRVDRFPR